MTEFNIIAGLGRSGERKRLEVEQWVPSALSEACGGCTVTYGTGYWLNDKKELINEPIVRFSSTWMYPVKEDFNPVAAVLDIAKRLRDDLGEDAVYYSAHEVTAILVS